MALQRGNAVSFQSRFTIAASLSVAIRYFLIYLMSVCLFGCLPGKPKIIIIIIIAIEKMAINAALLLLHCHLMLSTLITNPTVHQPTKFQPNRSMRG